MPKISTILIVITMLGLVYGSIRRAASEKKSAEEPQAPLESGPYRVPLWERALQIFLVFCTAAYALWVLGIKRFIAEELSKGGDLRPLILTLSIAVLMVAGLYFCYIYANRQKILAMESRQSPRQRYLGYLKIVGIWAFFIVLELVIF